MMFGSERAIKNKGKKNKFFCTYFSIKCLMDTCIHDHNKCDKGY